MVSGEIPSELGASWFSPKGIEVPPGVVVLARVEHGWRAGARAYQPPTNCEVCQPKRRRETAGAKLRRREGNSPDRQLRARSVV